MVINIVFSATVVINSTGGTALHHGGALGQFEYLEDKGYYVQTSTDQNNEKFLAIYLSRDVDDNWNVGRTPGMRGWLWNPSPSKTHDPPTSGWTFADSWSWISDNTLSVTPGPLPSCDSHGRHSGELAILPGSVLQNSQVVAWQASICQHRGSGPASWWC